jgi:hypothetical protein
VEASDGPEMIIKALGFPARESTSGIAQYRAGGLETLKAKPPKFITRRPAELTTGLENLRPDEKCLVLRPVNISMPKFL